MLPPKARAAFDAAGKKTKGTALKAGRAISNITPEPVKERRVRWSKKLRDDHRLIPAVEKLMKQFANGRAVPVEKVTKAMPVVAIFVGAGTNAYILGDVAHQARLYAQTLFLAEKYGLSLPSLHAADD